MDRGTIQLKMVGDMVLFWFVTSVTATAIRAAGGVETEAPTLLDLLMLLIVSPLLEEALFRGVVFRWLRRHTGRVIAYGVSAAAFAFLHGTPEQVYTGAACGLLFALLYDYAGKLYVPILAHAGYNVLTLALYGMAVPTVLFHPAALVLCNAGLIALFIVAVRRCGAGVLRGGEAGV